MKYRLGLIIAAVTGALLLTVLYGDQLREQVLRPFLYGLWLLWLRMQGLPFEPIWALFIGLAALAVYLGVVDLFFQKDPPKARQQRESTTGPILSLARKIRLGAHGDLARWNLYRDLGNLAIRWIALHEDVSESEARRRFHSGHQSLEHLRELLTLDFPDPDRPRRRLAKKNYLRDLDSVITALEDFGLYGNGHRRRGTC
ncbi:hypothetical protein LM602_08155 [Candidatus Acetothermia bacterium]|jgi:hypothetical protein|nr:hypothetical protein [Candidatus Acetothermia bacterium]MCI2432502.1 hypothetical protein [Candidatus Acetothermia bacterium]MCI2437292.1 hypothetical protein [Candidatus Acetothermia bacterium]